MIDSNDFYDRRNDDGQAPPFDTIPIVKTKKTTSSLLTAIAVLLICQHAVIAKDQTGEKGLAEAWTNGNQVVEAWLGFLMENKKGEAAKLMSQPFFVGEMNGNQTKLEKLPNGRKLLDKANARMPKVLSERGFEKAQTLTAQEVENLSKKLGAALPQGAIKVSTRLKKDKDGKREDDVEFYLSPEGKMVALVEVER
jgi:hypothetical protein